MRGANRSGKCRMRSWGGCSARAGAGADGRRAGTFTRGRRLTIFRVTRSSARRWMGGTPRPNAQARSAPGDPRSSVMGGLDHVRPLEMPEIVRLARELVGSAPSVRRLRDGLRGYFETRGGTITLAHDLFRDPEQAAKT